MLFSLFSLFIISGLIVFVYLLLYYHVWFEEHSFEEDLVVCQGLVNGLVDSLGDSLADLNAVGPIRQDFRLHDGHDSVVLADRSVTGEAPGVLLKRQVGRAVFVDFQHCSPFGESASF